jgi:hypothetical protein
MEAVCHVFSSVDRRYADSLSYVIHMTYERAAR